MYSRQTSDGDLFEFTRDSENLTDYDQHGGGQAHSDGFSLVAKRALASWEGIAFGRGESENPDRAEGYLYFDAVDDGSTDMTGQYELVVLNGADEKLATIARGPIDEAREGDPSTDPRGDWGIPFPYVALRRGRGEVMGDDYKIGVRVNLDSGTGTFSPSNSTLRAEGYSGRKQN